MLSVAFEKSRVMERVAVTGEIVLAQNLKVTPKSVETAMSFTTVIHRRG
jgi:hypothetical protein